jgi:hypothetical protein
VSPAVDDSARYAADWLCPDCCCGSIAVIARASHISAAPGSFGVTDRLCEIGDIVTMLEAFEQRHEQVETIVSLSLLKSPLRLRKTGDFRRPAVPSRSW